MLKYFYDLSLFFSILNHSYLRDGVGDGQIPYVKDTEVDQIESCFKAAGMEDFKFTYIIVSKRIMTRYFTGAGNTSDNPHSGTIVDDVITLPERLVSIIILSLVLYFYYSSLQV